MQLKAYPIIKRRRGFFYEFYSEGPRGSIKKVVEYYKFQELDTELFNLAFGDWDEINHRINDRAISDNSDRDKILATVATTIIDFMKEHPNASILAMGSTLSRSRLYQINIVKYLDEIMPFFEIQGYIDYRWHYFKKGVNYRAFLLKAK